MAISEESYLLRCWDTCVCPYCSQTFSAKQRVGNGDKKRGGFCSVSCYGSYYKVDLLRRHQHVLQKVRELKWE